MELKIIELTEDDESVIHKIAALLVESFKENAPHAWPDMESALMEVRESLEENRISLVAVNESGEVLGWIGGISQYDGNAWELHPLVVNPDYRGQGIGKQLVTALEDKVRSLGGYTIWLGTDDENNQTTISGINLYPDVCKHIKNIKNKRNHPYEFYQKLGYVIIGVLPDANGPGKPDILMAKSLFNWEEKMEKRKCRKEEIRISGEEVISSIKEKIKFEEFKVDGEELVKKVKELVRQGNIRRIIIKDKDGNTYFEIPLTIGVVAAVLIPIWVALGAIAALATNFVIVVEKIEESATKNN